MTVPIIDLFAGPGGLGEGFSRARTVDFEIAVSIEKDGMAAETLQLRAAHRALGRAGHAKRSTWARWDSIIAESPWNIAFDMLRESRDPAIEAACDVGRHEAWNLELGTGNREEVRRGIRARLLPFMTHGHLPGNVVLIGGPPCQAYSVVGRSRNRGTEGYIAEDDHRHFLYREYLRVIADFKPAAFVMENVKGILTSRVDGRQIFQTITADLKRPDLACGYDRSLEYVLVALPHGSTSLFDPEPEEYIVRAEDFGVPQARHRVIICGVRRDVFERAGGVASLTASAPPKVGQVIDDLPRLRPALSFRGKGLTWLDSLDLPLMRQALKALRSAGVPELKRVASRIESARARMHGVEDPGSGHDRMILDLSALEAPEMNAKWYRDRSIQVLANHQCRSHMPTDLVRYVFVAAFGNETGRSPKLSDFPLCLLPEHQNVDRLAPDDAIFKDRFRVQLRHSPSMTVTSHIAKDGHAFIHHDETQCRSLTVREAARIQTFPDSYVFLGNRTSQYTQVGNAVPPYLAVQIGDVVGGVIKKAGLAS